MSTRLALVVLAVVLVGGCAKPPALERGLMLYEQGRYRRALATFDEAVREQPSAAAYANRGTTRIRLGDTAGGIADFTSALQLAPNDSEILFNRGNARLVAGDPKGAIADFTRAAELRPTFALAVDTEIPTSAARSDGASRGSARARGRRTGIGSRRTGSRSRRAGRFRRRP